MARREYATDSVVVHWNSERCIHTAICLNTLPAVFDVGRRPWIDPTAAGADEVAAAVERCPTGALTYQRTDGAAGEATPSTTTIVPWPNGPLMVRGTVEVRDARGELFDAGTRMTLCRCGSSRNQPFCDLSHRGAGFRDNPRVIENGRETADAPSDVTNAPGP